jgi:Tol biopolymer transport system component
MSAPFPSGLTASPVGGLVAWVQNDQGVRNIWVAGPPEYRGWQLTSYTRDDGQEIGSLTWTVDGSTLYFIRGGAPNRQGEIPNPTSDPAGAERVLWRVDVAAGGEPVRTGPGAAPVMAPDGSGYAYAQGGAIWFAPLPSGTDAASPTALVRARGGLGSLAWSPDGSKLAFVSSRGTHAFVGVYHRGEEEIRWMDPSVDRDGSPPGPRRGTASPSSGCPPP